jgi:hypothetical protein
MNKEFIPYELEKELYDLGYSNKTVGVIVYKKVGVNEFSFIREDYPTEWMSGVLYQQAFRWFRENGYRVGIRWDVEYDKYWFDVWSSYKKNDETFYQFQFESDIIYNTYEEAELACLKKLIEIVKGKDAAINCHTFS